MATAIVTVDRIVVIEALAIEDLMEIATVTETETEIVMVIDAEVIGIVTVTGTDVGTTAIVATCRITGIAMHTMFAAMDTTISDMAGTIVGIHDIST